MHIILGKSNSGKSTYLYQEMLQDREEKKQAILFVPSQTRAIAESAFMREMKQEGVMGVTITTIQEFVAGLVKKINLHFDENYLSPIEKKILLAKVIEENEKMITVFKKVRKKEGFLDFMGMYIELFRKQEISVEKMKTVQTSDKMLENKIHEMAAIYEKYLEKMGNKYMDSISEIDLLCQQMEIVREELKNTKLYFDGYNNFTNLELTFIRKLLSVTADITITLTTDIIALEDIYLDTTNAIFEVPNRTYLALLKIANEMGVEVKSSPFTSHYPTQKETLRYLSENLFENVPMIEDTQHAVSMTVYANIYEEVEAIASKIKTEIKQGMCYSQMAIYTTDIENYGSLLSRVFYEYNIPLYVDHKSGIMMSKLSQYLLLLGTLSQKNMPLDTLLTILKLGLNDISMLDICYLENYIDEFGIYPYSLLRSFTINNTTYNEVIYDLERLNTIREQLVETFLETSQRLHQKTTAKDKITVIYEHLLKYHILDHYESQIQVDEGDAYDRYQSHIEAQIWDTITEVWDAMANIEGEERIDVHTFFETLEMAMKEVSLKTVPPTIDKVSLIDIDAGKVENRKLAFLVGVVENSFPKKVEQDVLFKDEELEKLKGLSLELKETSLSKENMGLYNIYKTLSKIEEHVYVSMPAIDILGNTTRKSTLLWQIQKTVKIPLQGDVSKHDKAENTISYLSTEKSFEYFVQQLQYLANILDETGCQQDENVKARLQEILGMYAYFKQNSRYQKLLAYEKNDANLSDETIKKIYDQNFKSSVYKLELFEKCPFSYYMKYILNISKKKVFEITSMDTGSFMHAVIEKFSFYLLEHALAWHEMLEDENTLNPTYQEVLLSIIEQTLAESFQKQRESVKYAIYKRKLTNTLSKVIVVIAKGFMQSEFVPYGYEIEFKDNGLFLPIEIELEKGKKMRLVGKMDRVDLLKTEDKLYARVVDYKSSAKSLSVEEIKEGISLQLITYLTAFIENEASKNVTVLPAAMLYFNLSNKLIHLKEYTKDEGTIQKEMIKTLRMNGIFLNDIQILEKMDHQLGEADKRLIDISTRSLSNTSKALDEESFDALCKEAKQILKKIGNEMIKGVVAIAPSKKGNACAYCDYSCICRKHSCV